MAWCFLSVVVIFLARENLSVPGLYYDEAVFAGMAKDFVTGRIYGTHMPGYQAIQLFGRPFPVFIQSYLGALKSWMLMPSLSVFGSTTTILRLTNLAWSLMALLFMILWSRRWIGLEASLLGGSLLALDPTYFFLGIFDWGSAVPSFLCRFAGLYLTCVWWESRHTRYAFLAAFFFGLGFFNKGDFSIFLCGAAIAGACAYAALFLERARAKPLSLAMAFIGFLLAGGAMILKGSALVSMASRLQGSPLELTEKINTMVATYDGSYFFRLMNVGGMFAEMYQSRSPFSSPLGITVIVAALVLLVTLAWNVNSAFRRATIFLLVGALLITFGILILPGAVRVHHSILVYPFPHLIIAVAALFLWSKFSGSKIAFRTGRVALVISVALLLFGEMRAIRITQHLIRETGGRGRWSTQFDSFCGQIKNRSDLTIVSLDWGFNEQLDFLTDGPRLAEPFWAFDGTLPTLSRDPTCIYLVHPPEYAQFPYSAAYLSEASLDFPPPIIQSFLDEEGSVAFYTLQFPQ